MNRRRAIERVRQMASRYGVDTAGWSVAVTDQTDAKHRAYLAAYPDDPAARLFGLLRLNVVLIEPGGQHKVRMALLADGRPAEWKWDGAVNGPETQPKPSPAPDTILADFIGAKRGTFTPAGVSDDGALRYDWEWRAADRFPLLASVKLEQKAGVLRSVVLAPVYRDAFEEQFKRSQDDTFATVAKLVGVVVWTAGLGLFLWRAIFGKRRWRIPLMLLAAQLVWVAVSFWGGTYYQEFLGRKQSVMDALFFIAGENSDIFWSFFWLFVFAGAGYAIHTAGNREKWYTLDLISRGRILNRTVGESLAIGLLSGIGLAALPYLVAAIRWLPGVALDFLFWDGIHPTVAGHHLLAVRADAALDARALPVAAAP